MMDRRDMGWPVSSDTEHGNWVVDDDVFVHDIDDGYS